MEKEKYHLKFESASTLLAKPEPSIEWLIENIWVDKSRGLIAGNPGVGKTWLALDMLVSVASGLPCLGKYAVKQGPVLLMEEEASDLNLSRRLHALARARGLVHSDLSNLHLATRQFAKLPKDVSELGFFILENDIRLVVFDSLRRFHTADENSSSEMQAVLDAFGRLSMLGCSVVLIHHLSKSSDVSKKPLFERLRGSSDFWAWRDCLIGMEGEEDANEAVCSFQFRDAEAQAPIRVKRAVDPDSGAILMTASGLEDSEEYAGKMALIVDYMQSQFGAVSKDQVLSNVKGRKQELGRVFKLMGTKKMILKDGLKWVVAPVPELTGTNGNDGND